MNSLLKKIKAFFQTTNETETIEEESENVIPEVKSENFISEVSHDQILKLVGEGNTKEALLLLAETHSSDVLELLQKRFDSNEMQYNAKLIMAEDWLITLAQINRTLLQMLPNRAIDKTISRAQIHELAEKGKIHEALHLLAQANFETAVLLSARFNVAEKALTEGRISSEKWEMLQAHIKFSLLDFEKWERK